MLKYFQDNKRENIKSEYKVEDFIFRYKRLEKILTKDNLDSILVITGVDSKDNQSYSYLINWLFLGLSGVQILENTYLSQEYSNIILIIQKGQCHLYITQNGLNELKHLVYAIPNLQLFCPSEEQSENENECELLKLNFFLKAMTSDIKKVGVMLGKRDENNVKKIEKWPLIQGYGISDLERGFFSMSHQPIDLTERINIIMKTHDGYSLQQLIYGNSKRLAGHFNAAAGIISDTKIHKRQLISEQSLCEILTDTYELEQLSKFVNEDNTLPKPRVLFGERTNLEYQIRSEEIMLKQLQTEDEKCCFLSTFEGIDLHSQVRAGRTYFLKKNVASEKEIINILDEFEVVQNYDLKEQQNEDFSDEEMLVNLYANLIISFQEIMSHISKDYTKLNKEFIQEHVLQKMIKVQQRSTDKQQFQLDDILIDIKCFNAMGEHKEIDFNEQVTFKLSPVIFMIRLQVKNIKSIQDSNKLLGSILFAESFVLQEGCFLFLTKDIPYIQFFQTENKYSQKIQDMKKRIVYTKLGKQFNEWDPKNNDYKFYEKNRIFIPTEKLTHYGIEIPIQECKFILHDNGIRLFSQQLGWIVLFFQDFLNVKFTTGLKKVWMIFQLEQNIVLNALGRSMVCFEFGQQAEQEVMFKIREYFDQNSINYGFIEGSQIPVFEESNLAQKEILQKKDKKIIKMNQIYEEKFLLSYIQSKQQMILNGIKDFQLGSFHKINDLQDIQVNEPSKIGIIFINGAQNQGKVKFAQNLLKHGQSSNIQLYILQLTTHDQIGMDTKIYINKIINLAKQNKAKGGDILVCPIPHWISTGKVADYFQRNEKLANVFYVRNIFTKINISHFYNNKNKNLVPNILQHAVAGYSQSIIFETYDNEQDQIQEIEKIVKSVHNKQKIFSISGNILNSNLGKEILSQSLYMNDYNRFNRDRYKILYDVSSFKNYQQIFIPHTYPLTKLNMYNVIKKDLFEKKQGYMWSDEQLNEKMKQIRFEYQDSEDELAAEILKIREKIEINKLEKESCQIDYIKAVVRIQDKFQDGLYELTFNNNYLIQKKMKNVKVKFEEIEINENEKIQYPQYSGLDEQQQKQLGYIFVGQNLDQTILENYLNQFKEKQPELQPLITEKSLSHEKKKEIQMQQKDNFELTDGVFFDGYLFRDENGLALQYHPNIDQMVEIYLQKENEEIQKINDKIIETFNKKQHYYESVTFY